MEDKNIIPKRFRAMWNNQKSRLRIDLPSEATVKVGTLFVCSVKKVDGRTQIIYTSESE